MIPAAPRRWQHGRPIALVLLLLAQAACSPERRHNGSPGIEAYVGVRDLHDLAERYRLKHQQPALGVGVIHRGRTVGLGMAGERRNGSGDLATLDDPFDVASCAKPVTATVAAMLVEDGRIRWDTTLHDAFPELRGSMHPGFASATLEHLLRHRAGLRHELSRNSRWAAWNRDHPGTSASEQRQRFAAAALQQRPVYPPGTDSDYSSDGYVIAGAMLERAARTEWEDLVRERVFRPLGMSTAGYGTVAGGRRLLHVSGHESRWLLGSRVVPADPSEYGEPPFGSPAGFLYVSVPDLLRFVDLHIQGSNGRARLLSPASFERLHAPVDGQPFSIGWSIDVTRREQGRVLERSLYHGGYSGRFRANIWFAPETGWGTAIVMNHGRGDESISADIFDALLREFRLQPTEPTAN